MASAGEPAAAKGEQGRLEVIGGRGHCRLDDSEVHLDGDRGVPLDDGRERCAYIVPCAF
jgi:hypothetical protein